MGDEVKVDIAGAKKIIAGALAELQGPLNSHLTPGDQKMGLKLAYCQLLGNYAMLEIREHLLDPPADKSGIVS